jgi:predicted Co/Zn/Cd cation transporter (cation efflux family)
MRCRSGAAELGLDAAVLHRVAPRGFVTYSSYVARAGRAQFIEICIVLPRDYPIPSVALLHEIRTEIGDFVGEPGPQRWLTITFTGDASTI